MSVTLNGITFNDEDFEGYGYIRQFPTRIFAALLAEINSILIAAQGGHVIQDEGASLPQRATLNFVGNGVVVTDSAGKTLVTINGGASSIAQLSDWPSGVSVTELGYLDGLTASIVSLLANKSDTTHNHTIPSLTGVENPRPANPYSRLLVVVFNPAANRYEHMKLSDLLATLESASAINGESVYFVPDASGGPLSMTVTGSGGFLLGGTAPHVIGKKVVSIGGFVLGGAAFISYGSAGVSAFNIVGSGGLLLGGAATIAGIRGMAIIGSGGLLIGGAGTIAYGSASIASFSIVGTGGFLLGGAATIASGAGSSDLFTDLFNRTAGDLISVGESRWVVDHGPSAIPVITNSGGQLGAGSPSGLRGAIVSGVTFHANNQYIEIDNGSAVSEVIAILRYPTSKNGHYLQINTAQYGDDGDFGIPGGITIQPYYHATSASYEALAGANFDNAEMGQTISGPYRFEVNGNTITFKYKLNGVNQTRTLTIAARTYDSSNTVGFYIGGAGATWYNSFKAGNS